MSHDSLPEPLDDFLRQPPSLPLDSARKEMLFQQTAQALPGPGRPRVLLPIALAAAVLFGFVLSYFVFRVALPGPEALPPEHATGPGEPMPKPPGPAPAPVTPRHLADDVPPSARDLEWKAFDAADDRERTRLYLQAGNLYLAVNQDIESALRCYDQALSQGDAQALAFDPKDNWLVMALKTDRRKEN